MSSVPLDLKTLEEDFGELSEISHLSEEEERELSKKVASDILAGFDKHYRLFRYCAQQTKKLFEEGDWHLIQQLARDRIDFYDERVKEAVDLLRRNYGSLLMSESVWAKIKTRFVTYLVDHKQPELAETFFNSAVTKKIQNLRELSIMDGLNQEVVMPSRFKNFGVTRLGRVVFYDYDEIEYMTDSNFRRIPDAPNPEAEMSSEPWYTVGPKDVFPEEFGHFLLGDRRVRKAFLSKHRDLLEYEFWQERKDRITQGHIEDIFPYSEAVRFTNRFIKKQ